MKKFLVGILFLILTLTTFVNTTYAITITDDILSNSINKLNAELSTIIDTDNPNYLTEIIDDNGNVPAYEYYPNQLHSRSIKNLTAYDGKIFMGLGDWNNNTGPAKILYYDTVDEKIKSSGTIEDEAVQSFTIIDDELYTTGCDPRASGWVYGSYYIYNKTENNWEQHQNDSGWIHVFDIEKFKDRLYMCGSTNDTCQQSTILVSSDNGQTFESIPVYKDDVQLPYDDNLRCTNLINYNNKLYGYIHDDTDNKYIGFYLYDETNNRFNYISTLPYVGVTYDSTYISRLYTYNRRYCRNYIFKDQFIYVSSKNLYKSTDLINFEKATDINVQNEIIQDVAIDGDTLYTLLSKYNYSTKIFTISIYKTTDLSEYSLVYSFNSETPPFSMEYYDNNLYIGTAYGDQVACNDSSKNGTLYKVSLDNTKNLTLNKDAKTITLTENNNSIYEVDYDLSDNKAIFNLNLNFNNNMDLNECNKEYYKMNSLNLIFASVYNTSNKIEDSIEYFNNILNTNITEFSSDFTSGTEYAKNILSNDLNIEESLFTLTSKNLKATETQYQTQVTLTIDMNNIKDSNTDNVTNNIPDNNTNNSTTVEDYINNNNKLPQTGQFFNIKNVLQIIIILCIVSLTFLIIKEHKKKHQ